MVECLFYTEKAGSSTLSPPTDSGGQVANMWYDTYTGSIYSSQREYEDASAMRLWDALVTEQLQEKKKKHKSRPKLSVEGF